MDITITITLICAPAQISTLPGSSCPLLPLPNCPLQGLPCIRTCFLITRFINSTLSGHLFPFQPHPLIPSPPSSQYCPVGDVTLLANVSLIWTSVIDSLIRRVCPTCLQVLGILVAFTGTILVTQPSFLFHPSGTFVAEGGAGTKAASYGNSSILKNDATLISAAALANADSYSNGSILGNDTTIINTPTTTTIANPRLRAFPSASVGHALALVSGLAYSLANVIVAISSDVHWTCWSFSQGVMMLFFSAIFLYVSVVGRHVTLAVTPLAGCTLVLLCVFDVVGRIYITLACQAHTASLAAMVGVAQIPLTYAWSYLWLGEVFDRVKALGIVLILFALMMIGFDNLRRDKEVKEEGERRGLLLHPLKNSRME